MPRPASQRRPAARWLTALGTALLALALMGAPAGASALSADPASNYPEQIPPVCATAPRSVQCTQAGIVELDQARVGEGRRPYRLPSDFLGLSGAHQLVVLTNLDRAANRQRMIPGTTAALDRAALAGARAGGDPIVTNPDLSWAANWAGDFPAAVWAYLAWMYDDGYGGPNLDCPIPAAPGCWGHRHDILARFPRGGTLEMGAADLDNASYTMIIAQSLRRTPVHYAYRFARR